MGNKKKRANTDPIMSIIRDSFQNNLQLAKDLQRERKSDIVTTFDLTEKFYTRRIKAVAHLMPEMTARYAEAYPDIEIANEFADVASLPILSYDIIDRESYLCLGAAIWMLDQIWEEHKMQELCDLLPEDCDYVEMPDVYDTRFSYEIIERMLYVIRNRYGETDRYVVPQNILSKKEAPTFYAILDLIPDAAKEMAVTRLKTKFWKWADLYFKALNPMVHESNRLNRLLNRLTDQLEELHENIAPKKPIKPTLPLTSPLPFLSSTSLDNPKREAEMLIRQIDKAEETQEEIRQKVGNFRFMSLQAGISSKYQLVKCMDADFADAMSNFPVENPYELCFAILYLFDKDDDYAWVYSFMIGVICRAASMLPWGFERYDEEDDGFWFDDGKWIPSLPLNPEWYETTYAGRKYADDEYEPHDVSIAQIVYEHTGAILPRNMHRFDDAFRPLKKRGMKPSEANMVCAIMNVLGEASRQRQYDPDIDDLDWDDTEPEQEEKIETAEKENPAASEEVEKLKKELTQLKEQAKKANYSLSRENRELKEKLEKAETASAEMTQELADLREIVFNQQNESSQQSGAEEKKEEAKVTFPYHTTRRIIAFGGHDSWLREIKFKVPDVRFMGEDISSPEVIRRADVVWIQTNCIGHKSYYGIIDLARKYGRKVRYFKYASATKCAEQVVEEENTDK